MDFAESGDAKLFTLSSTCLNEIAVFDGDFSISLGFDTGNCLIFNVGASVQYMLKHTALEVSTLEHEEILLWPTEDSKGTGIESVENLHES